MTLQYSEQWHRRKHFHGNINVVDFNSDATYIAVGGGDKLIIYTVDEGKELAIVRGHSIVKTLKWLANKPSTVICAYEDGSITNYVLTEVNGLNLPHCDNSPYNRCNQIQDTLELEYLNLRDHKPSCMALSTSGRRLATGSVNNIRVWEFQQRTFENHKTGTKRRILDRWNQLAQLPPPPLFVNNSTLPIVITAIHWRQEPHNPDHLIVSYRYNGIQFVTRIYTNFAFMSIDVTLHS